MATETVYNTSTTQPWEVQQPFLDYGFNQARSLYGQGGPSYYGGDAVANFSPYQNQALTRMNERSINGSSVNQNAQNTLNATNRGAFLNNNPANQYLSGTARGDFLNSNPYMDANYNNAAEQVMGNINSQFASGGRYGSGIHQDVMGKNLGDMASQMYGNNYANERQNMIGAANSMQGAFANERQNMMQGVAMSPSIANQDYYDMAMQNQAGGQIQSQAQAEIDANMARHAFEQNRPYQNLQNYNQNVSGNYGQSTSGSQTNPIYEPSFGQQALGYGMAGVGLLGAANDIWNWW